MADDGEGQDQDGNQTDSMESAANADMQASQSIADAQQQQNSAAARQDAERSMNEADQAQRDAGFAVRGGDTPGFGTGGGQSVGGGGGYGSPAIGGLAGPGAAPQNSYGADIAPVNLPDVNVKSVIGPGFYGNPSNLFGPQSLAFNAQTVGVPSLVSSMTIGPPQVVGIPEMQQPSSPYAVNTVDLGPTYSSSAAMASNPAAVNSYLSSLEQQYGLPPGTMNKLFGVESGYGVNNRAFSLGSGASGPFQITESTGQTLGLVGPGYDYRLDFQSAAPAAAQYAAGLSSSLQQSLGRTPTAGELGLAYNQGAAGAAALLGNPTATAQDALAPAYGGNVARAAKAITNNGGDPLAPASDFSNSVMGRYQQASASAPSNVLGALAGTASSVAMAALSAPATFADTLQGLLTGPSTQQASVPTPTPRPDQQVLEAGIPAPSNVTMADLPAPGASTAVAQSLGTGFVAPEGSGPEVTAAQAATSSPQTFGEWLGSLLDSSKQVQNLEAQGRTTLFSGDPANYTAEQKAALTETDENGDPVLDASGNPVTMTPKEWYADQMNVPVSEVKSRVVQTENGPQVDYYTKDLGTALGEAFMAPINAITGMFGGSNAATQGTSTPVSQRGGGSNAPDTTGGIASLPIASPVTSVASTTPGPQPTTGIKLTSPVYDPTKTLVPYPTA